MENSPAFVANVLPGDILIEINNEAVANLFGANEQLKACVPSGGDCPVGRSKSPSNGHFKIPHPDARLMVQ